MTFASILLALTPGQAPADHAAETWTQERLEHVAAEIQAQIEELRGQKFTQPVKVHLTDAQGLVDYATKREAATETPGRRERDETVAKLLGLVRPEQSIEELEMKVLQGQVAGFYDPQSKTFYLMDKFAQGAARMIMSHELTHALDDQLYDLDGTIAKAGEKTDAELALRCVFEGSGTNAMYRWYAKHKDSVTMEDLLAAQDQGTDALKDAPAVIWKPLVASYLRGDGFLAHTAGLNLAMKPAKTDEIARAFRDPPRSTEQVLHPDKYWKDDQRDDPLIVTIDTTKLAAGWRVMGDDVLGEMVLALLTSPVAQRGGIDFANPLAAAAISYTNKAAEGWGGDRVVVLANGDERFLELVTAWDTEKDADEFAAAALVPAFEGAREESRGFRAGVTPTQVAIERASKTQVVVRVASTPRADHDAALVAMRLSFTVEAPKKK